MIRSAGTPVTEFTHMMDAWPRAMLAGLPHLAAAVDSGDHATTGSSVRMQAVGFVNLLGASRDLGISPELLEPMHALLNHAVAAGHGESGRSSLIDLLEAR